MQSAGPRRVCSCGNREVSPEGVTGKYFVKSIPKRSAAITYDESLQRQLWDECAKLVNLPVKV